MAYTSLTRRAFFDNTDHAPMCAEAVGHVRFLARNSSIISGSSSTECPDSSSWGVICRSHHDGNTNGVAITERRSRPSSSTTDSEKNSEGGTTGRGKPAAKVDQRRSDAPVVLVQLVKAARLLLVVPREANTWRQVT